MDTARLRLDRQFLTAPAHHTPADVVRAQGAVQAQDYAGAKWGLAVRMSGATDAMIDAAFDEGTFIRTHVLRPTWHFVAPEDLRWMLALTGPRVSAAMASSNRRLELDAQVFRRSRATLERVLRDGHYLTRAELGTELSRARIGVVSGQRLAHIMMQAELDAVVCSGPRKGKHFTYALLEERVPQASELTRDEALVALTRRYFATRSPATVHDFSWWSGLTVADATRAVAMAETLSRETMNGKVYWYDPSERGAAKRRSRSPHVVLLPNYDEYFIGYRDRSAIGERLGSVAAVTGGDARIVHVIVVDGQLVGGWKRVPSRADVTLSLMLETRLAEGEARAVAAAVRRYEAFLGVPVAHQVTQVPAR